MGNLGTTSREATSGDKVSHFRLCSLHESIPLPQTGLDVLENIGTSLGLGLISTRGITNATWPTNFGLVKSLILYILLCKLYLNNLCKGNGYPRKDLKYNKCDRKDVLRKLLG